MEPVITALKVFHTTSAARGTARTSCSSPLPATGGAIAKERPEHDRVDAQGERRVQQGPQPAQQALLYLDLSSRCVRLAMRLR